MASQLESSRPANNNSGSVNRATKVTSYVNQQLEKTRRQVKSNDLVGGLLTVFAIALGLLLLAAIWDAWILPLTSTGRWVCLGLLIGSCLLYAIFAIVPLMIRRINPDYAAKMIEDAKPTFKNSLLNYVSLSKKNETINPAVFDAVSRQAATDLATVPADSTVDRSKLIRLGFVLVGLMMFAVGYKMLSPKDPLQTFGRVLAPFAKIAQPAVVKISDVQPGDMQIFFGDPLEVTATVRGRYQPNDVFLEYSTLDGQLTNQRVPMLQTDVPTRFRGALGVAGTGIQQSLTYRVVALDGVSPDFSVKVQANPTIAVESLVLSPPAYTKLSERTLVGQGSIETIEGTRVTIHAIANLPIQSARIELLQATDGPTTLTHHAGANNENEPAENIEIQYRPLKTYEMIAAGKSASGQFTAMLNSSRQGQLATHYRLTFITTDGDRNLKPNVYPIKVIPDLAPIIDITRPNMREVVVAENGSLAVDIEAQDLDFEIANVEFQIDHQGTKLLNKNLQLNYNPRNQKVTARYDLKPADLRLKAGDKAIFFAIAKDNRTALENPNQADPNISRSENFTLTVIEPEIKQQPEQKKSEQKSGEQQSGEQQSDQNQSGEQQSGEQQSGEQQSGEQQSGEQQSDQNQSGEQQSGEQQSDQNQSGEQQSCEQQSDQQNGSGESGEQNDAETQEENQQNQNSDGGSNSASGGSESQSDPETNDGTGGGGSPTEGNEPGSQKQPGGDGTGDPSTGNDQAQPASPNNNNGPGGQQNSSEDDGAGGSGRQDESLTEGQRQPLDENASPGEQFQRLEEVLKEQGDKNETGQGEPTNETADPNQTSDTTNPPETGEQQPAQSKPVKSQSGESQSGESQSGESQSGESQSGESQSGESQSGESQSGESQSGESQSGESQSGESQSGESQSGESQSGESQSGESQSGESQSGESQSGESQSGESQSGESQSGESQSGESQSGESQAGESAKSNKAGSNQSSSKPATQPGQSSGAGTGELSTFELEQEATNLEHAKKATDLILSKLNDQKYNPDPKLLEEMNWTQNDLNNFVERWQKMKAAADSGDPNANQKYERSLKSLGLRPNTAERTVKQNLDQVGGLNTDNEVIQPPPELAPDFNATLRDINR